MRSVTFILVASIGLSSCAAAGALFRGAGSVASRGAVVEASVARAGAAGIGGELAASQGLRSVSMSARVAASSEPIFGSAFAEVATGSRAMLIDSAGYIRTGTQQAIRLQGRRFYVGDEIVARLENGRIFDIGSTTPVARLGGSIPGKAIPLELSSGVTTTHARSVFVDVLDMQGGRYLISTPAGQVGWVDAAALGLVVLAAADEQTCTDKQGGVLIRKSGEPITFDWCEGFEGAVALHTRDGRVAVSREEVSDYLYGEEASAFLQSQTNAAA